jgi:hypothetical protein
MRMLYISLAVASICLLTFGGLFGRYLAVMWLGTIVFNYAFRLTGYQRRQVLALRPPA